MANTGNVSEMQASLPPYAYPLSGDQELAEALGASGLPEQSGRAREQLGRLVHRAVRVGGLSRDACRRLEELAAGAAARIVRSGSGADSGSGELLLYGTVECLGRLGRSLQGEAKELAEAGSQILWSLGPRPPAIRWGGRCLEFGPRPLVMGILNCTPDSFYPGSRLGDSSAALEAAARLIDAGADILDVGGESTRPGSDAVSADEEMRRVLPVVEGIRRRSDVVVSIDTRKRAVAQAALDSGADLVNDIAAMSADPRLLGLVAERQVPVVLMHMRGEPKTMQVEPHYDDPVSEIIRELARAVAAAVESGVSRERIILDPGVGFGKRCQDNLAILAHLQAFTCLGRPLLVGLSRKSFLGTVLDAPVEQRLIGTVAANTLAVLGGADIVRVHDVPEAVQVARLVEAVRLQRCGRDAANGANGANAANGADAPGRGESRAR